MTGADAIRRAIAQSVQRLVRHDPVVREGVDPEGVHQARVATRRLRSDLRTFSPLLDPDWTAALRDELREIAALLGAVRDADVLLDRLRRAASGLSRAEQEATEVLLADLSSGRDADRAKLLAAMDDPRYQALLADLREAAAHPRTLDAAQEDAAEVLPRLVVRPWRRLERAVDKLGGDPPDAALHEVRILAKRVRYAAEAVTPVAGPVASEFARSVAGLQDVLGDHHDAVVAAQWLREAAARHPTAAFAAGSLAALEDADARRLRRRWRSAWRTASRKRLRAWM